ncbi:hypothetical protein LJC74_09940, partial [Eubacteriales bacterium OttesenSCG-928-A19]|nr:hypothetical protein [Eubacteriales bacterium OttesenSCG-928-A19]
KEMRAATRFVVMSCFEDYAYVREAMRMGAVDYLLKHTYQEKDIAQVIGRIRAQMAEQAREDALHRHVLARQLQAYLRGEEEEDGLLRALEPEDGPPGRHWLLCLRGTGADRSADALQKALDAPDARVLRLEGRILGEQLLYAHLDETALAAARARLAAWIEDAVGAATCGADNPVVPTALVADTLEALHARYQEASTPPQPASVRSHKIQRAIAYMQANHHRDLITSVYRSAAQK